jgi:hypothetical protein
MSQATIDRLIINSPYEEPAQHWSYERKTRLFLHADMAYLNGKQAAPKRHRWRPHFSS